MQNAPTLPGVADTPQVNTAAERAAKRGTQSSPDAEPEVVRYSIEALREDSVQLLGVTEPAVVGALFGETRKTFTLDEMKRLVEKFLKREHA